MPTRDSSCFRCVFLLGLAHSSAKELCVRVRVASELQGKKLFSASGMFFMQHARYRVVLRPCVWMSPRAVTSTFERENAPLHQYGGSHDHRFPTAGLRSANMAGSAQADKRGAVSKCDLRTKRLLCSLAVGCCRLYTPPCVISIKTEWRSSCCCLAHAERQRPPKPLVSHY